MYNLIIYNYNILIYKKYFIPFSLSSNNDLNVLHNDIII